MMNDQVPNAWRLSGNPRGPGLGPSDLRMSPILQQPTGTTYPEGFAKPVARRVLWAPDSVNREFEPSRFPTHLDIVGTEY